MKSTLFNLIGLNPPGTVHLFRVGQVNLCEASDDVLLKAYLDGCPYLEPTPDGAEKLKIVDKKPEVTPILIVKKPSPKNKKK